MTPPSLRKGNLNVQASLKEEEEKTSKRYSYEEIGEGILHLTNGVNQLKEEAKQLEVVHVPKSDITVSQSNQMRTTSVVSANTSWNITEVGGKLVFKDPKKLPVKVQDKKIP